LGHCPYGDPEPTGFEAAGCGPASQRVTHFVTHFTRFVTRFIWLHRIDRLIAFRDRRRRGERLLKVKLTAANIEHLCLFGSPRTGISLPPLRRF